MTTRQWFCFTVGLWVCLLTAQFSLDGLPRVLATAAVTVCFIGVSVERFRNWHRTVRR